MKLHKTKEKSIYYYHLANGEKRYMYRHLYYDVTGKRREKSKRGFTNIKDAMRSLLEVKAALLNDNQLKADNHNMTIGQWFNAWYETYSNNWAVSTRVIRKNFIDKQLKLIAHYKLKSFTKTMLINHFIKPLQDKYATSTVKGHYTLFKVGVNAAVDDEVLDRNRFNKIQIDDGKRLTNFLTPNELKTLLKYTKKHENITNYTAVLLLSYTGLRKGEALGLTWNDIDFENSTLTVKRTRDQHGSRSPKTGNSYRTILIDDVVTNQLRKYKKQCVQMLFSYGQQLKDDDYVLLNDEGTPLGSCAINRAINRIKKRIKNDEIKMNDITVHGLRHTHCTILINNGVPINTIADRLGNTPQMILNIYSHSFEELEQKAVNKFSETLGGVGVIVGE